MANVATQPRPVPAPSKPAPVSTIHNSIAVMSPVNQNGSFEFDRVIKAGVVLKRTRKTRQWKPITLVLRPNLLSIYKGKDETRLRHQISLSDLTAVARQKDTKKKKEHVFGLFTPARNYHLSATTELDAQEWVDLIRTAARIDQNDDEMVVLSPSGTKTTFTGYGTLAPPEHIGSSSSENDVPGGVQPATTATTATTVSPENIRSSWRYSLPSHTLNYSGNEHGSFSDFSDTAQGGAPPAPQRSSVSLSQPHASQQLPRTSQQQRNVSRTSELGAVPDDERVIYHGWLYVLKSKGGVRQWKKVWVVLRPKALGLYKNEEEYSANLIIPFTTIIDAVDIDPASRSKKHCMQIISEEKNYRFCAPDEDSLARWLGAFKSVLIKRKEAQTRKEAETQRVLQSVRNMGNIPVAAASNPLPKSSLVPGPTAHPPPLQPAH